MALQAKVPGCCCALAVHTTVIRSGGSRCLTIMLEQLAQRLDALGFGHLRSGHQQREVFGENFLRVNDVSRVGADLLDKSVHLIQAQQQRGTVAQLRGRRTVLKWCSWS